MDDDADARLVERDLAARGRPLLRGGSVYCSIFSGGARPRRCALTGIYEKLSPEDLGWEAPEPASLAGRLRDFAAAGLVHTATMGRIAGALGLDAAQGIVEAARWARALGSMQHEHKFFLHRVLTECLFAEFAANATVIDVARGTPIVYACFIGYGEYAHRRGPYSKTALLKLWELGRALGRILAAVAAVPELGYETYLFSDHGQAKTRPAEQILGESLGEHLLNDAASPGEVEGPVAFGGAGGGEAAVAAAQARRLRALSRALPGILGKAALACARRTARALDAAPPLPIRAEGPLLVVPAGDLAHVYSTENPEQCLEPELRTRHPGLIERCAEPSHRRRAGAHRERPGGDPPRAPTRAGPRRGRRPAWARAGPSQEVGDPHRARAGERRDFEVADHAAHLGKLLDWTVVFGPNLVLAGKPYGNAILSRLRIAQAYNYDLSIRGREPRGCLRADLELPGSQSLHLFNLHLGLSRGERRKQAAMLLSADLLRDTALTAPLVVCGDFNLWWPVPGPIVRLLRTALRDAAQIAGAPRPTWPSQLPLLRLDRAFVDDGVTVLGCGVWIDARTRRASDHLPLWLDLEPRAAPVANAAMAATSTPTATATTTPTPTSTSTASLEVENPVVATRRAGA